jgi:hypothetical protein
MGTDLPQSLINKPARSRKQLIILVLAGIGLLLIGFVAGYYANNAGNQTSTRLAMTSNGSPYFSNNGPGGYQGYRTNYGNRIIGQVTSISGQTIVITDQSGTSQTINVTTATQFSNGASLSQIAVGDTIMVVGQKNSSNVIQATRIIINPSFYNGSTSSD